MDIYFLLPNLELVLANLNLIHLINDLKIHFHCKIERKSKNKNY